MTGAYVPDRYWTELHRAADDERAVGYPYLARSINRARYDVERGSVRRALTDAGVASPKRVLDAGSGTGVWIDFWSREGAEDITGVDLTDVAVSRLRSRYPEHRFLRGDLCDGQLPPGMDVVSAMSVLLHITDERRFERALNNLMGCVRPGGALVLVEPVLVHRWWGAPFGANGNSKARPLAAYERILRAGGFELRVLRPSCCLLTNVIDTRRLISFRLLDGYWRLLCRAVGTRQLLGRIVAPVLRATDLLATRMMPTGPSVKVLVARRIDPGP